MEKMMPNRETYKNKEKNTSSQDKTNKERENRRLPGVLVSPHLVDVG